MKKKILGICITLLFLVLICFKIDFYSVLKAIKLFHFSYILPIVIIYISTLLLRGIRWKLFLNNDLKYSYLELANISTVGTMFNIFIPARAGDIFRAYYLGHVKNENKIKIFGSVILERIFDGIAVFIILLFSVKMYFSKSEIVNLTTLSAGILFLGSFLLALFLFQSGRILIIFDFLLNKLNSSTKFYSFVEKMKAYTLSFSQGFMTLNSTKSSLLTFALSLLIWALECIVVYIIINSFELVFPFSAALFVLALTTFSTMLPSTSIFLGPFQAAYILALGIYGADKELALAIAIVHNIIITVIISLIGLFWIAKNYNLIDKNTLNR